MEGPSLLNGGEPGSFLRDCDASAVVEMNFRQAGLEVAEADSLLAAMKNCP
ncbi:hypothetical protein [Pseudarthrobacter sulfonivorans]|uniref:hypothetical protein n=1 Tax=Pseudarthrobacter sulfonivorans TaxID=121292 RepID=UPI00278A642E|nr:hypothetical protein [Pseudarthrobacter sulfonivorans]MDP9998996.1 hypothetical protein [Pseudarthrobacter sulfonivorans]